MNPKISMCTMSDSTRQLAEGIKDRQRHSLAKAITLVESSNQNHRVQAKLLLEYLARVNSNVPGPPTLRIGIAGPPGYFHAPY